VLNIRAELVSWIFDPDILIASLGNAQRVFLNIDCPGGSADAAIRLYDALVTRQVEVQIDRLAVSSGAILAMAGQRRRVARHGWFLVHSPIAYSSGSPACLRAAADELEKTWTRFRDILEVGTGQSRATVESWLDGNDHCFNAADSMRAGLATEIYDPVVPVNPSK
jgi:ATP-dependent protease ClpP protease subunit